MKKIELFEKTLEDANKLLNQSTVSKSDPKLYDALIEMLDALYILSGAIDPSDEEE